MNHDLIDLVTSEDYDAIEKAVKWALIVIPDYLIKLKRDIEVVTDESIKELIKQRRRDIESEMMSIKKLADRVGFL